MPWILPLYVPVPGLPWAKVNKPPFINKGIVLTVKSRDTSDVIVYSRQVGWRSKSEMPMRKKSCLRFSIPLCPLSIESHSRWAYQSGTWYGCRREGQDDSRSFHEGGFCLSSNPMAWGRAICMPKCNTVYLAHYWSLRIPVSFWTAYTRADKQILVDSGATDSFINPWLIKRLGLGTQQLQQERKIWNINGTSNKAGMISDFVDLQVQTKGWTKQMRFLVTNLGIEDLILGYPLLALFEPKFSWSKATIDVTYLLIIIQSLNWEKVCNQILSITSDPTSKFQLSRIVTTPLSNDKKRPNHRSTLTRLQSNCNLCFTIGSRSPAIHKKGQNTR